MSNSVVQQFSINDFGETKINLIKDAKILSIKEIEGNLRVWVETPSTGDTAIRTFRTIATGEVFNNTNIRQYIDTIISDKYPWGLHVYEEF